MDPAARIVTRSSECTLGKVTSPSAVRLIFHPSLQLSSSSSSSGWAESQDESAPVQNARNFFAAPTSPAKPLINLHVSLPRTSFFGLIFPFPAHIFSICVWGWSCMNGWTQHPAHLWILVLFYILYYETISSVFPAILATSKNWATFGRVCKKKDEAAEECIRG